MKRTAHHLVLLPILLFAFLMATEAEAATYHYAGNLFTYGNGDPLLVGDSIHITLDTLNPLTTGFYALTSNTFSSISMTNGITTYTWANNAPSPISVASVVVSNGVITQWLFYGNNGTVILYSDWAQMDGAWYTSDGNIARWTNPPLGTWTTIQPDLIDPVPHLLKGTSITSDTDLLATWEKTVKKVSADGVTQVIVRMPADYVGEQLTVSVVGQGSNSVRDNGGLFPLGGSSSSPGSTLQVRAVRTTKGPMAFAIYLAPFNFAGDSQNFDGGSRTVSLQVQSPTFSESMDVTVLRPPVAFVHGLWGSPGDWAVFATVMQNVFIGLVNYDLPVSGVTGVSPSYPRRPSVVSGNALGFAYNAAVVKSQIRSFIQIFKIVQNAAAVQADVVAHSMGGDIVRTMAVLDSNFLADDTYGSGPVHKLITIGTPHLGSPLAALLLDDSNACVRNALAIFGSPAFLNVTVNGGTVSGGVGDLQPDSGAVDLLSDSHSPFPYAMIGATENQSNLQGLDCSDCMAGYLRAVCGFWFNNPLATNLTSSQWESFVFFGQRSDAIVPLESQLNGKIRVPYEGAIHTSALERLNFNGPDELSYSFVAPVVDLLNEPSDGGDFYR